MSRSKRWVPPVESVAAIAEAIEQSRARVAALFRCPSCDRPVRGDLDLCPACGLELATSWTAGEQRAIDREAAGQCECCGRPIEVCDAAPCFGEE